MSNIPLYLHALASFKEPATSKEVHRKAVEMFGDQVRGDKASARQSLDRYAMLGRVKKIGLKYEIAEKIGNTPSELEIRANRSEMITSQLRADLQKAQSSLKSLQDKYDHLFKWYVYQYEMVIALEMRISKPERPDGDAPVIPSQDDQSPVVINWGD